MDDKYLSWSCICEEMIEDGRSVQAVGDSVNKWFSICALHTVSVEQLSYHKDHLRDTVENGLQMLLSVITDFRNV